MNSSVCIILPVSYNHPAIGLVERVGGSTQVAADYNEQVIQTSRTFAEKFISEQRITGEEIQSELGGEKVALNVQAGLVKHFHDLQSKGCTIVCSVKIAALWKLAYGIHRVPCLSNPMLNVCELKSLTSVGFFHYN